jgi:hypothetical protein
MSTTTGGSPDDADAPRVQNIVEGDVLGVVVQAGSIGELHLPVPVKPRVPRLLPEAPIKFVNRERELAALDQLLSSAQSATGTVVAVLSGMHGVGKSAMGSQWVNDMWGRFEGGALYGDFSRWRHRGGVDVSDVLGEFISELGTADEAIPATLAKRRQLFRRMTVSKRLLIMLDDVGQSAEVEPLLPAGAGSVVVVTSNSNLEELLYRGAELIELEPLPEAESRRLLGDMAGASASVFEDDPHATGVLVSMCGGLPIASASVLDGCRPTGGVERRRSSHGSPTSATVFTACPGGRRLAPDRSSTSHILSCRQSVPFSTVGSAFIQAPTSTPTKQLS